MGSKFSDMNAELVQYYHIDNQQHHPLRHFMGTMQAIQKMLILCRVNVA